MTYPSNLRAFVLKRWTRNFDFPANKMPQGFRTKSRTLEESCNNFDLHIKKENGNFAHRFFDKRDKWDTLYFIPVSTKQEVLQTNHHFSWRKCKILLVTYHPGKTKVPLFPAFHNIFQRFSKQNYFSCASAKVYIPHRTTHLF